MFLRTAGLQAARMIMSEPGGLAVLKTMSTSRHANRFTSSEWRSPRNDAGSAQLQSRSFLALHHRMSGTGVPRSQP